VAHEIHLVNPLWGSTGGSVRRTVELYRLLSQHTHVSVWTEHRPDAAVAAELPIDRIDMAAGIYPRGGTIVFIGVYHQPGDWVDLVRPRRAIVVYNIRQPRQLVLFMRRLFAAGIKSIEIVYASQLLKEQTKLKGIVENSPIDLARFRCKANLSARADGPFIIGKMSRDDPRKHHADDLPLYQQLVAKGCRVRIMGGMDLARRGMIPPPMELLPAGAETPEAFLHSLDCFVYRTDPVMWETFGRVIVEAMACGLPVVCHRTGGYVSLIRDGENGFLFDTNEQAAAMIARLRSDSALYRQMAQRARASVEAMYSPEERARMVAYYLL